MGTKNMCRRVPVKDGNGMIFGRSGSGKSAVAKLQIADILEHDETDRVYVVDVYGEYMHLAKKLHGEIVNISISPMSQTYLNPLDIDMGCGVPETVLLDVKARYIVAMLELMHGRVRQLDQQTKAVITRCVSLVYKPYIEQLERLRATGSVITCDKGSMPTLARLYNALREQPEPEAQTIANIMELYVEGRFALFSHHSNINTNTRFVVYSCKMFSDETKELVMLAYLNDIWNKMIENSRKGLRTWVYVEDMDRRLICYEPTRQISMNLYETAPLYHGNIIGISGGNADSSVKEIVKAIMPSGFISTMAVDRYTREILKESLNLSKKQEKQIAADAPAGHGLFCTKEGYTPFAIKPSDEEMEYIRI